MQDGCWGKISLARGTGTQEHRKETEPWEQGCLCRAGAKGRQTGEERNTGWKQSSGGRAGLTRLVQDRSGGKIRLRWSEGTPEGNKTLETWQGFRSWCRAGRYGGKMWLRRSTGAQVSRKKGLKADKDRKWEGKAHHMRREPKKLIKK